MPVIIQATRVIVYANPLLALALAQAMLRPRPRVNIAVEKKGNRKGFHGFEFSD
jgi:hypothetical protein